MTVSFVSKGLLATFDGNAFNEELNKLGEQGWELVSTFHYVGTREVIAVLKRPLE
jgi:hypothetical protein